MVNLPQQPRLGDLILLATVAIVDAIERLRTLLLALPVFALAMVGLFLLRNLDTDLRDRDVDLVDEAMQLAGGPQRRLTR